MPDQSKNTGEWPEVEMVIDVCDDPPRPFLSTELDPQGAWRENAEYLTERYLPLKTIRERLLDPVVTQKIAVENLNPRDADIHYYGGDPENSAAELARSVLKSAVDAAFPPDDKED